MERPIGVLALDPGTRRTGLALFEGRELVYGKVRDFGHQKSKRQLLHLGTKLLETEILRFRPQVLAIEKTLLYKNKNTDKLQSLGRAYRRIGAKYGLRVVELAPRTVRSIVCQNGNATKRIVAEQVCRHFPELHIHLEQTHFWKETYWGHMYDAVAVGLAHLIEEGVVRRLPW